MAKRILNVDRQTENKCITMQLVWNFFTEVTQFDPLNNFLLFCFISLENYVIISLTVGNDNYPFYAYLRSVHIWIETFSKPNNPRVLRVNDFFDCYFFSFILIKFSLIPFLICTPIHGFSYRTTQVLLRYEVVQIVL